jgi:hypothetical protein
MEEFNDQELLIQNWIAEKKFDFSAIDNFDKLDNDLLVAFFGGMIIQELTPNNLYKKLESNNYPFNKIQTIVNCYNNYLKTQLETKKPKLENVRRSRKESIESALFPLGLTAIVLAAKNCSIEMPFENIISTDSLSPIALFYITTLIAKISRDQQDFEINSGIVERLQKVFQE